MEYGFKCGQTIMNIGHSCARQNDENVMEQKNLKKQKAKDFLIVNLEKVLENLNVDYESSLS
jgi:hypothetical protein